MSTTSYRRGDVVLGLFPDSNLKTAKRRPVLIIQADNLATGIPQWIVAMISSNMARVGHSSRIEVLLSTAEGQASGLQTDSVIMTDNLATILEKELDRVIGVWTNMAAVDGALRITLGL